MGALLALALAVSGAGDVAVAHRQVVAGGVRLTLSRYSPPGDGAGRHPVLLLPELGFGRRVFDLHGRGLARWLSARGFLVYVGEVRGQGGADPTDSLAAIARVDVPALLAAIARDEPGPVDVVVHGWAGTLALAGLSPGAQRQGPTPVSPSGVEGPSTGSGARGAGLTAQVRRVVAINTPVLAEVPSALVGQFLAEGGRFAELGGSPEGRYALELMLSMGGRFPSRTLEALRATGVRDLSPSAAASLLGWMKTGDLALGGEDTVTRRFRGYDKPTLQLLALADGFASPELCAPLRDVSRAKVEVHTFSRAEAAEDYSHLSVLLGSRAERDVFPLIERFFSEAR